MVRLRCQDATDYGAVIFKDTPESELKSCSIHVCLIKIFFVDARLEEKSHVNVGGC